MPASVGGSNYMAHSTVQIEANGDTQHDHHPLLQQGSGGQLPPPATPSATAVQRQRSGVRLALLAMVLLVFQGTALSIALRYSRIKPGRPYLASVSGERGVQRVARASERRSGSPLPPPPPPHQHPPTPHPTPPLPRARQSSSPRPPSCSFA